MKERTFKFKVNDGQEVFLYNWVPQENIKPIGVVQIAHGMAETAQRYRRFANELTQNGYVVYANDHRGHGKTAKSVECIGDLGEDGFYGMLRDMHDITGCIKEKYIDLPLFILGHSMGSFLTQRYIQLYGKEINGAVLSGSCGKQGIILDIGRLIAKREIGKIGRSAKSKKLNDLSFGGCNKAFRPNRTEFDWLSRDEKEVDKYIKDECCGGIFTAGFFYDFLSGLKLIENRKEVAKIPKTLPLYIFSGEKDPVGKEGKGVIRLVNTYKDLGIKDLEYKLYKEGRHEMLNEMNKDEVMEDIVNWLNKHI